MSSPTRSGANASELQFDRAIPADGNEASAPAPRMLCPRCKGEVRTHYYHADGQPVCPACKQEIERTEQRRRSPATFMRALVFGLGASIVGAILYYGVIALLDLEIGIVAILTGYLVGKAVRSGARGAGGRRYQVLALGLTYFSVALAYLPIAIKASTEPDQVKATADSTARRDSTSGAAPSIAGSTATASTDSAAAGDSSAPTVQGSSSAPAAGRTATTKKPESRPGAMGFVLALGALIGLTLALPVIVIFGSMPGGLLSALIIGFGLRQAWRMTGDTSTAISGPYKVGGAQTAEA